MSSLIRSAIKVFFIKGMFNSLAHAPSMFIPSSVNHRILHFKDFHHRYVPP